MTIKCDILSELLQPSVPRDRSPQSLPRDHQLYVCPSKGLTSRAYHAILFATQQLSCVECSSDESRFFQQLYNHIDSIQCVQRHIWG